MDPLSAGWQAAFFILALVLFVGAAVIAAAPGRPDRPRRFGALELVALGLAAVTFVSAWNALAIA